MASSTAPRTHRSNGSRPVWALTRRGFWIRVMVFSVSLLVYTRVVLIMSKSATSSAIPVVLPSVLRLIVIVVHTPSRRPR
jgi:hypothetical protein